MIIPKINLSNLKEIDLYFKGMETGNKLAYSINVRDLPILQWQISSPEEENKISLPIVVFKELASEKYKLTHIVFNNDSIIRWGTLDSTPSFEHISNAEDTTTPSVLVDNIALTVLNEHNEEGGSVSILAKIPVIGLDSENIFYAVRMRTPDGKILYKDDRSCVGCNRGMEILKTDDNGNQFIEIKFDLKPYHEEGIYTLSMVNLIELYGYGIYGLNVLSGDSKKYKNRFIERGIRKTIKITQPSISVDQVSSKKF